LIIGHYFLGMCYTYILLLLILPLLKITMRFMRLIRTKDLHEPYRSTSNFYFFYFFRKRKKKWKIEEWNEWIFLYFLWAAQLWSKGKLQNQEKLQGNCMLIKLSLPRGLQAFGLTLISNTPLYINIIKIITCFTCSSPSSASQSNPYIYHYLPSIISNTSPCWSAN
jgi:hypothetical protein